MSLTLALFPETGDLIGRWGMFLFSGPICICAAIGLLVWGWRKKKARSRASQSPPDDLPPRYLLLIGSMGMLAGIVQLVFVWWSIGNELALQFDPMDVEKIEIRRFRYNDVGSQELDPAAPIVTLSNPDQIRRGLQTLTSSVPFDPNHESRVRGFSLRLQMRPSTGGSEIYFAVHRDTSRTRNAHLVIPMEGPTDTDGFVGGQYRCDAFASWFESEIVPLIEEGTDAAGSPN